MRTSYATNYSYTNSQWGDLCTSEFEEFDAIGNPTSYGLAYLYWEGRQLTEYYDWEDDFSYTYAYNDAGVRISKTVDGILHEYVVDGIQIQREVIYYYNSTNPHYDLRYYYDANGNPTAIRAFTLTTSGTISSDTTYYLGTNLQGDVVAIYNSTGTKIYSYVYDAWGNLLQGTQVATGGSTANSLNPFRYRGYYYDTETGWYYLNSRYYSPGMGRFINADGYVSTGQGLLGYNMFAYCNNNPIALVDGSGNLPEMSGVSANSMSTYGVTKTYHWFEISPILQHVHLYDSSTGAPVEGKINVRFSPNNMNDGVLNPVFQIENSYLITNSEDQFAILAYIRTSEYYDQELYGRTMDSMMVEWKAHNHIYFFSQHERVAHTDFDKNDEETSYLGYWWRAIIEMLRIC